MFLDLHLLQEQYLLSGKNHSNELRQLCHSGNSVQYRNIFPEFLLCAAGAQKEPFPDPEDKTGKVIIEYTPMVDEVRISYTCMYNLYEQGKAMNAILGCLEDFTKDNNYYHYKYMEKDRERYYKDNRGIKWAEYTAHVKFTR